MEVSDLNEICLGCKKLCKKLKHENAKNCPDYDPKPKKKVERKEKQTIIIRKR